MRRLLAVPVAGLCVVVGALLPGIAQAADWQLWASGLPGGLRACPKFCV